MKRKTRRLLNNSISIAGIIFSAWGIGFVWNLLSRTIVTLVLTMETAFEAGLSQESKFIILFAMVWLFSGLIAWFAKLLLKFISNTRFAKKAKVKE